MKPQSASTMFFSAIGQSPKISSFEEQVNKHMLPPPGCYDIDRSSVAKAKGVTLFGKSTAPRFVQAPAETTPGPAAYKVQNQKKPRSAQPQVQPTQVQLKSRPTTTAMAHKSPVPPSIPSPNHSTLGYREDPNTGRMTKVQTLTSPLGGDRVQPKTKGKRKSKMGASFDSLTSLAPKALPGPKFGAEGQAGHCIEQFLIQPSGGKGGNLYSKHRPTQHGPTSLVVVRPKAASAGGDFKSVAFQLQTQEDDDVRNPGPSSYNIRPGERWTSNGICEKSMRMGNVALPRYYELFERQVYRESFPGPGAYVHSSSLSEKPLDAGRPATTTTIAKAPRFKVSESLTPAPNTYTVVAYTDPQQVHPPSMQSQRFQQQSGGDPSHPPFGTTEDRFKFSTLPGTDRRLGPGAYKSDVVTSMNYQIKKRVAASSNGSRAFGTITERFDYDRMSPRRMRRQTAPAPGDYNVPTTFNSSKGTPAHQRHAYLPSSRARLAEGIRSGLYTPATPSQQPPSTKAATPPLSLPSTMASRFNEKQLLLSEAPPPGSYNVDSSFKQTRDHGKIEIQSAFQTTARPITSIEDKRETFFDHMRSLSPGPAWYDQKDFVALRQEHNVVLSSGPDAEHTIGFLAKDLRQPDFIVHAQKTRALPGPASYELGKLSLEHDVRKVCLSDLLCLISICLCRRLM